MSIRAETKRTVSLLALLLGAVSAPNCYAQAAGGGAGSTEALETVTVTGYRASLTASADAKRTNIGFTDSVVAEDIGKFPDRNLAEAINRIPGVTLTRSDQGEGSTITIRGLGANFSQVLVNGNRVVVGGTVDRSTPMELFPVELFNKITVSKSLDAHSLEGGIGGNVNIVNVRPFDNPEEGFHLNYSVQEQYAQSGGSFSPRGAVIASQNWGNKFGVLFAVAASNYKYRGDNYESIGVDIPGSVDQQRNSFPDVSSGVMDPRVCPTTVCVANWASSKPFHWASVVPPGISAADAAAYGLGAAGSTYVSAGPAYGTTDFTTPGGTSGLSVKDLSRTIVPHLPRTEYRPGYNMRLSFLTSVEYQPSENLHFVLDAMYERQVKHQQLEDMQQYNRQSCNLAGTNGPTVFGAAVDNCQIPVNFTIDSTGNLLSGKFLNSQYFLDSTETTDRYTFVNINPSVSWTVTKWLKIDGSAYFDDSPVKHHQISLMVRNTGTGISTTFTQTPGAAMPTLVTNAPFNDPTAWQWYLIRAQPRDYAATTKGTHWDATIGTEQANLRVGYAYDEQYRRESDFGAAGNVGNCIVLGTASGGTCTLPDGSAMAPGTPGLLPNSALSSYFISGPADFMQLSGQNAGSLGSWMIPDLHRLMATTEIRDFENSQAATATPQVAGGGSFGEKAHGFYIEANATTQVLDRDLHINAGVRYVATHQTLTAPVFTPTLTIVRTERDYDAVLPSLNVSMSVMDNLVLRFAGNRSMTRATPASMFPGFSFPTADMTPITAGNPNLTPYFSDNFDLGLEYYPGGPGLIAINAFSKDVSGFTVTGTTQMKFGDTGIPYSVLTPLMQAEYNANGGNNVQVILNGQVNLQQKLHIRGIEVQVVQPLDFVWEGIGVTANYTRVQQHVDAGLTPSVSAGVATGIAPWMANFGAYYEGHGFSMHVTYNYTAAFANCSTPCYNGVQVPEYTDIHRQVDLAASYVLPLDGTLFEGTELTFDAVNLNNEVSFRKYVGNKNAPSAAYWLGPQYTLGLRGKF